MNIAFLSMLASEEVEATGVKTAIWALAPALVERGHEVSVVTCGPRRTFEQNGVRVVQLGSLRRFKRSSDMVDPRYVLARVRYMLRAARALRLDPPDVLEVSEGGFEQLFLLRRKPCPIIVRLHGNVNYTLARTLPALLLEQIESIANRCCDAFYCPSRAYARMISRDYQIARERIEIIPYGVDLDALRQRRVNEDLRQRFGLGKRKIVLFTGMLTQRKGASLFVEIAKAMQTRDDVVFVAAGRVGAGVERSPVPENTLLTGELEPSTIYALYREASIFFTPSRFENLSLSIIEAIACGLPVVAFAVGGNQELVGDGENGFLVDPSRPERIPTLLADLLEDPALRASFAEESLRRAERFEIHSIAARVEELFERSIRSSAIGARTQLRA